MTKYLLSLTMVLALGGCAVTDVAYYVDHEYSKAQVDAFDQQIAYRNGEYSGLTPNSMAGVHSEKIMDTYQYSFDKDTAKAPTNSFSRGTVNFDTD